MSLKVVTNKHHHAAMFVYWHFSLRVHNPFGPGLLQTALLCMLVSKLIVCNCRAFEKIPRKGKEIDPAESGGHNLLEEMSLLELRQRLAYTKQRHLVHLTG